MATQRIQDRLRAGVESGRGSIEEGRFQPLDRLSVAASAESRQHEGMSRDVLGSPLDLKLLIDSVSQMSVTRQNVEQTVSVASNGELVSEMLAQGDLTVRAVMEAGLGDPVLARIREHSRTGMADQQDFVSSNRHQRIIPNGGPVEQLHESLRVGPNALTRYRSDERCGP